MSRNVPHDRFQSQNAWVYNLTALHTFLKLRVVTLWAVEYLLYKTTSETLKIFSF